MKASAGAYDLIMEFEGFSDIVYRCPAGVPTIGYGHAVREGERFDLPLSEEAGRALLERDVVGVERAIARLIPRPLRQGQIDAMVSFTYNVGAGALQRSSLRQKLLRGEDDGAGEEFLRWVFAGGRRLPGLIRRRVAERKLYIS